MLYSNIKNEKIKNIKKLNQKKYRDRDNLFIVEGEHLVLEAYKKGMIKELRRRYPESNVSAIDYDPGSSEVNQLNRLKLLLSNAPVGKHPDEEADGMIHQPDKKVVKPEIQMAEGAFIDPEPVEMKDVPVI